MKQAALYVGAGRDVVEPLSLPCRTFVFVDSLPATQQPQFDDQFAQRDLAFVTDVVQGLKSKGFSLSVGDDNPRDLTPRVLTFTNEDDGREAFYHISTGFPDNVSDQLIDHIHHCDVLIDAGHHPHAVLLDIMRPDFTLVCYPGTYYGPRSDREEPMNVIDALRGKANLDIWLIEGRKCLSMSTIDDVDRHTRSLVRNP